MIVLTDTMPLPRANFNFDRSSVSFAAQIGHVVFNNSWKARCRFETFIGGSPPHLKQTIVPDNSKNNDLFDITAPNLHQLNSQEWMTTHVGGTISKIVTIRPLEWEDNSDLKGGCRGNTDIEPSRSRAWERGTC